MFRQNSLASIGLVIGIVLIVLGLGGYIIRNPTLNLAGFFYGFPLLLGGFALKITEVKPVPMSQPTSEAVLALRDTQATPIQTDVRKDVTRYRYGIDGHLDAQLERIGIHPAGNDCPKLVGLQEQAVAGAYALVLEFDSPEVSFEKWQAKQEKITTFFGPGIEAVLTQPSTDRISLSLISQPNKAETA